MDKLSFSKLEDSIDFQKGVEIFRKRHNLPPKYPAGRKLIDKNGELLRDPEPIKFKWYGKSVSKKSWNKIFSKMHHLGFYVS